LANDAAIERRELPRASAPIAPVRANRELFAVARYSVLQHCPLSLFDSLSLKSLNTLGNTAVACAAVDDVTAWRLLAVVIATVKAPGFGSAILTILLTLVFICLMLFALKRQANRVINATRRE
jgi:hypothetical protein